MRRRLLPAVLLACAVAGLTAAPASAALETIVQDDAVMLYSEPAELTAAAQRLKALGVDRVRITANWSVLTRDASSKVRPAFDARDPAAYEQSRWANLDNAVRAVRAAGMGVLIDIGFWAPHWATSSPPGPKARKNVKPKDYANFAVALVRRYSGKFRVPSATPTPPPPPAEDENPFEELLIPLLGLPGKTDAQPVAAVAQPDPLPRVNVFALWNEPNFPGLFLPQWKADKTPASPRVYRRMVSAAYPAIKQVRNGTRVLIGNTSSVGGNPGTGAVAPLAFLRGFACVDRDLRPRTTGECAHFHRLPGDGWAHHPYTRNEPPPDSGPKPDDVQIADLPKLARTLRTLVRRGRLASGYKRIYLTEFGYETKRVGTRPRVSQAAQARWLTWSEYLADRVPAVQSFAQFLLRDQPAASSVISDSNARPYGDYSTGLLTADGAPKTAARTFRAGLFAARRSGGRRVMLYGRLRLGSGKKAITLERRTRTGKWTTIAHFTIDGQSSFQRTVDNPRNAIYRLTFPGQPGVRKKGLAVRPVSRSR
jgi:hypothetical protein